MADTNARYGLSIDYEFCTGCHSCEVACKKEHDLPEGVFGIRVLQDGPQKIGEKKYEWWNVPVPGVLCDLCAERTGAGKLPLCVQSCQAKVMAYGPVTELAKYAAEKEHVVVFSVK